MSDNKRLRLVDETVDEYMRNRFENISGHGESFGRHGDPGEDFEF